MLLSSMCEEKRSGDFCGLKEIIQVKFTGHVCRVWGRLYGLQQRLQVVCILQDGNSLKNAHHMEMLWFRPLVFPRHAMHGPVNFTRVKKRTRPTLCCSSHVDSNMHAIFLAQFTLLSLELHMKKPLPVVKTSNYISAKFQHPSCNTNTEKMHYFSINPCMCSVHFISSNFLLKAARVPSKSGNHIKHGSRI